jgi:hypothetical protein
MSDQDHDQRFKVLREFFPEFLRLFYPDLARRLDLPRAEWLMQEHFRDPPAGQRALLDLVAKVPVQEPLTGERAGPALLVHLEVEAGDTAAPLRRRMRDYGRDLEERHGMPVLPIAIYLKVARRGLGRDHYRAGVWEFPVDEYHFWYVGLPGLDGETYAAGDQWLGVALSALMRVPRDRRVALTAEVLDRLVRCPESSWRRYLLCELVQAYVPLSPEQRVNLDQLLMTERYQEVKAVGKTWTEMGREQGQRRLVERQLEKRFGPLTAAARQRLEQWPVERLEDLALALLTAASLRDLGLED